MNTWIVLLVSIFIYWMGLKLIARLIRKLGRERNVTFLRMQYVSRTISTVWTITVLLIVSLISGIQYEELGIVVSSVFALLGVALFAQWSILSNITASIMIFFFFPFRVGNWIRVFDKDDSVEGEVIEITLFHVIVKNGEGTTLTYPNSMIFQKAVSIRQRRPEAAPAATTEAVKDPQITVAPDTLKPEEAALLKEKP
ncbi:mechanosensitive ion channel family protein [Aestuariibacter sp. AA17]|uniref:Small-conductance mechanosensitive channel n=1 Tax=Fluctibacter corallii TaxID=2984329 RepID=A0ABT3A5Z5_9ALTE|nr:mechanosensitive ion channel family protein [Aestuariibacter sp. AA17]MCV2884099.1 mechanosensitive ion channel family protein [Aestuariibacter sp. AA17]